MNLRNNEYSLNNSTERSNNDKIHEINENEMFKINDSFREIEQKHSELSQVLNE
ncbi:9889_t:CDS:1, partial [Cetraspora pellucida]